MKGSVVFGSENDTSIVFLHGAMANLAMWMPEIDLLEDRFRCIALDLPGHGELRDEKFSLEAGVEVVRQAIEERAAGHAVVVGISLGGYVGMATAAAYPDHVTGLVASGAAVAYTGMAGLINRLQGALLPLFGSVLHKQAEQSLRRIAPERTAQAVLERGHSFKGAGQAMRDLAGRDFHALIASYAGPVLMLMGERDTHNIDALPVMTAGLSDVETVIMEDAGHSCSLSQPGRFSSEVARFVRRVQPA